MLKSDDAHLSSLRVKLWKISSALRAASSKGGKQRQKLLTKLSSAPVNISVHAIPLGNDNGGAESRAGDALTLQCAIPVGLQAAATSAAPAARTATTSAISAARTGICVALGKRKHHDQDSPFCSAGPSPVEVLKVLDDSSISLAKYHKLAKLTPSLPSRYGVIKERRRLDAQLHIKDKENAGVQRKIRDMLKALQPTARRGANGAVRVKISGDGSPVGNTGPL